MLDGLLCMTANAFRTYLIKRCMDTLAGKSRLTRKQEFGAYGGFFILTVGLYLAFHTAWVNVLSNIIGMIILTGFYNKPLKVRLFIVGFIYLILAGCDVVGVWLFVDYVDGEGFDQIFSVLSVFFVFICELLTEKIVQKRRNTDTVQNFSLIIVPIISIILLIFLFYVEQEKMPLIIVGVGLLLLNFFLLYLYNALCEAMAKNYENEILRQQVKSYANQLDVILQSENRVRALRHDLKHHLTEIQYLAEKNNTTEIRDYILRMQASLQNPNEMVSTGNMETDSVLNYMLQKAREKGFTVSAKVKMPKTVIHSYNLNVILGNLLENAIEAGEQAQEKILNVNICMKQGVLRIEVENTYQGKGALSENSNHGRPAYLTTKADKEQHGIGLSSVRQIVEENNGSMELIPDEKFFRVRLILYYSN